MATGCQSTQWLFVLLPKGFMEMFFQELLPPHSCRLEWLNWSGLVQFKSRKGTQGPSAGLSLTFPYPARLRLWPLPPPDAVSKRGTALELPERGRLCGSDQGMGLKARRYLVCAPGYLCALEQVPCHPWALSSPSA